MKCGHKKDADWEYLGALLARCDDGQQTEFFKAFIKECLSWGTSLEVERQMCFVNGKLTNEERSVLSMLSYMGDP